MAIVTTAKRITRARAGKKQDRRSLLIAAGFLLPSFLGFVVFTAGPLFISLAASLTDWNLVSGPGTPVHWIGLRNYIDLFVSDTEFHLYLVNTLYLLLGMPIAVVGSLLVAILLSQKLKGIVIYRTLFYLPTFTSGVAIMILWKALLNPDFGPINTLINGVFHFLGLPGHAPLWLQSTRNLLGLSPNTVVLTRSELGLGARDALVGMGIWIAVGGNNMLLYLAALANVPLELYEAASLDGAGRWATFRHITLPQVAPTTFFIVIMSIIGGLQAGFDQARVMTQGGPAGTTTTVSYDIYDRAFEQFQMGYASAISWLLFLVILVATFVLYRFGRFYSDSAHD